MVVKKEDWLSMVPGIDLSFLLYKLDIVKPTLQSYCHGQISDL